MWCIEMRVVCGDRRPNGDGGGAKERLIVKLLALQQRLAFHARRAVRACISKRIQSVCVQSQ